MLNIYQDINSTWQKRKEETKKKIYVTSKERGGGGWDAGINKFGFRIKQI